MQSLTLLRQGQRAAAADCGRRLRRRPRHRAGTLNGTTFEWIADADSRLGPMLEVLVERRVLLGADAPDSQYHDRAAERRSRPGLWCRRSSVDQRRRGVG
jgi:hypothetical protein